MSKFAGRADFSEGVMASKRLTSQQRKEIFSALVASQDELHNVRKSYEHVTEQYDISEEQLKEIEDEGVENEWPPLAEAVA
jgi:ribonuclease HII